MFPEPYGWQNIVNESSFNPINASITAWTSTADGLGWIFACSFIILLVPYIVYTKTQSIVATIFGLITITLLMYYYKIIPPELSIPIGLIVILGIGTAVFIKAKNK